MYTYKLKWTSLERDIFSLLCTRAGEELSQRDIAKELDVSPTAVANSVKDLIKHGLISLKKLKNINLISFNYDDEMVRNLKRIENLRSIYDSGLSNKLRDLFPGDTIVLFGSYSRGEDTNRSDIDIAIIGGKKKVVDLDDYRLKLNREISLQFYDSWKGIHKYLKNNILNGIILSGSVDL